MTETLEAEVHQMCNLSQGVLELGRAEGRAEGRTEGRTEGLLASIRALMASMGWSAEQAMEALKLPEIDPSTPTCSRSSESFSKRKYTA